MYSPRVLRLIYIDVPQFATLTPLEPRLIKKLLSPLMNLIKTTPAMSLLYECINGVIQGGILNGAGGTQEAEEIASLCVGKLRGMIVVEGDPNRRSIGAHYLNHADDEFSQIRLNSCLQQNPNLPSSFSIYASGRNYGLYR